MDERAETNEGALRNSLLVVAHPDDEVLWFGSLLDEIDQVVIVFCDDDAVPGLGARRQRAIGELPFSVTCLGIPEAGSYQLANWGQPIVSPAGLALEPTPAVDVNRVYEQNFVFIRAALAKRCSPDMNVFTHNPWGEYGHEDHVQVFRALESLGAEVGFNLCVSTYISSRAAPLAELYASDETTETIHRVVDPWRVNQIADIYKRHDCWTWADDWVWNESEHFVGCPTLRAAGVPKTGPPNMRWLQQIPSCVEARLPAPKGNPPGPPSLPF